MPKFINFNLYVEVPEDITITAVKAEALLAEFEDRLNQESLNIEETEFEFLSY